MPQKYVMIMFTEKGKKALEKLCSTGCPDCTVLKIPEEIEKVKFGTHYTTEESIALGIKKLAKQIEVSE